MGSPLPVPARDRLAVRELALVFLKIGATAFGESELVLIERELIERRPVLTKEDLTDALTYTKALPGSTVVQLVAFLAYRIGGWRGSAVATVVYLLPSTLAMVALAAGYLVVAGSDAVRAAAAGLTSAAAGLLLATSLRLARRSMGARDPLTIAIGVAAALAGLGGLSTPLIIVAAGAVGIVAYTSSERRAAAPADGRP